MFSSAVNGQETTPRVRVVESFSKTSVFRYRVIPSIHIVYMYIYIVYRYRYFNNNRRHYNA